MGILMTGLEHNCVPIALREQLAFSGARAAAVMTALREMPEVSGCVLISTCNRTELYLSGGEDLNPAALLCAAAEADFAAFRSAFVTRSGDEAVRHLMEVAAGLRSRIWGEDQILAQVKNAIEAAREQDCADPHLETLFRAAVSAGKGVKTALHLREMPASAPARAVALLRTELGDLGGKKALVIGSGEMGRLSAQHLRDAGCSVTMTLRTYRHGETVIPAGVGAVPFEARYAALETADILISATASPHYTVTLQEAHRCARLPRLMMDLAMPRDIDPAVGQLPGLRLWNVDDLETPPCREIPPAAAAILDDHMNRFHRWLGYRESIPVLEQLEDAVCHRIFTDRALESALDETALIELAVHRTVELMAGGLGTLDPEQLRLCAEKIRSHTTGRPVLQAGGQSHDR